MGRNKLKDLLNLAKRSGAMDWDKVEMAIGRAVGFIISTQDPDGLWRDFETLAGSSSDWVSGFVLRALSISPSSGDVSARAVSSLTSRQRQNGGWSYNRIVPTDCDSTSWVLLAISPSLHRGASPIQKGGRYLWKHQDGTSGGFATYCPWDRVHEFIGVTSLDVMSGWFSPHICVTGVAVQSLLEMNVPASDEGIQKASMYIVAREERQGALGFLLVEGLRLRDISGPEGSISMQSPDYRDCRKCCRLSPLGPEG